MMDRLRRKLNSRRGASIVIALLVLFVCITAGTAALTAASANAGRYTHMRTDQQRYLAVASAARLVRDQLSDQTFSAAIEVEENLGLEADPDEAFQFKGVTGASYTGKFKSWLESDLKTIFQATAIPDEWWGQIGGVQPEAKAVTYDGLGLEVSGGRPLLDKVKWSLTLDDDYTITARFRLEDGGVSYYPMVLTIPGDVTLTVSDPQKVEGVVGQRYVTTRTVEVRWSAADAVITQS